MVRLGLEKLNQLTASQENFIAQLDLDTGNHHQVVGPITRERAAILEILNIDLPVDTRLPLLTLPNMCPKLDFAKVVKDIRATVPCFNYYFFLF